jgi:hypothetical protein
MNKHDLVL